jgi:hypothetical protein
MLDAAMRAKRGQWSDVAEGGSTVMWAMSAAAAVTLVVRISSILLLLLLLPGSSTSLA